MVVQIYKSSSNVWAFPLIYFQPLVLSVFLIVASLVVTYWYLTMSLLGISLVINEAEAFFHLLHGHSLCTWSGLLDTWLFVHLQEFYLGKNIDSGYKLPWIMVHFFQVPLCGLPFQSSDGVSWWPQVPDFTVVQLTNVFPLK